MDAQVRLICHEGTFEDLLAQISVHRLDLVIADEAMGKQTSVKGGSLDEPVDLRAAVHIWTARQLPGVIIPETAVRFLGEPE